VTVAVKDDLGNPLANQTVTLTATGSGNSLSQPSPTDATGTTLATFSATGAGEHRVSATAAGIELGDATITVTPGPAAASRTTTQVPNGIAGQATVITLTVKDEFGNAVSGAKGQVAIDVTGANSKSGLGVQETGGGGYTASYTPKATGTDEVEVRVAGSAVPGSPFASTVGAGPGDPAHTTADVPEGSLFFPVQIVVHVADAEGNPVGHGGDQVSIVIGTSLTLNVVDRGDGSYAGSWTPLSTGTFKVNISLNGTAIAGSPFSQRVRAFR
jgi:adhesin/invasin